MGSQPDGRSTAAVRQFYVAVGTVEAKLTTLVELLQTLRVDRQLPLAIACSSRDSLDAVAHALAACSCFNLAVLHADLELHDAEQQVAQLKRFLQQQQQPPTQLPEQQQQPPPPRTADGVAHQQYHQQQQQQPIQAGGPAAWADHLAAPSAAAVSQLQQQRQQDERTPVLLASDSSLKGLGRDLAPLGLPLLIQFDLPASKEVLLRRLAAVFGSSKERGRRSRPQVVIDFVAAGEAAAFRARERLSSAPVMLMPVHVPDIFL